MACFYEDSYHAEARATLFDVTKILILLYLVDDIELLN
jgi:hypothetical protein